MASRAAANAELARAMARDQGPGKPPKPGAASTGGRGRDGTNASSKRGTSMLGRPGSDMRKMTMRSSGDSRAAGAAKGPTPTGTAMKTATPVPKGKPPEPKKTEGKTAAKAPVAKKMAEKSWASMTRTGRGDTPAAPAATSPKPKRVSPSGAAVAAAQPKRSDYKGKMVMSRQKSASGLRRDK